MSNEIQAVLFDMDDTLLDWSGVTASLSQLYQPHVEELYAYLAEAGYAVPVLDRFTAVYRQIIKDYWAEAKQAFTGVNFARALRRLFAELALDVPETAMPAVLRAYNWQPFPGVVPFADCHDVLDNLQRQGYRLGLVTNSMLPMWMRDIELTAYGLLGYFDVRVTSGDVGYMKPHPIIYETVLSQMGVAPETAVFVGDRPTNDIAGANELGMVSVQMAPPYLQRPNPSGVIPDYTITTLSQLPPLLAELT